MVPTREKFDVFIVMVIISQHHVRRFEIDMHEQKYCERIEDVMFA
jgi:hypothetical protein